MKVIQNTSKFLLIFILCTALSSCKKGAGEGGNSSITGKVWVKHYTPATNSTDGEYAGTYEDVYIIYGDEESYGEKTETNPEGNFEFRYLRPGKYKVYTYSKDVSQPFDPSNPDKLIIKDVVISKKKTAVDAGTLEIYDHDF